MQTQTTFHRPTNTTSPGGAIDTSNDHSLQTMHMLIRGDSPMNGAIVEPIDNQQATLLARARRQTLHPLLCPKQGVERIFSAADLSDVV